MIAEYFRDLPEGREPYGSHLPILGRALDLISRGPVLELGMGDSSTRQLHEACDMQGRRLFSYDHVPNWVEKFLPYRNTWHAIELTTDYGTVPIEAQLWAVALVDHGPGARRNTEIRRLKDRCMLIVCHDSEPRYEKCYEYGAVFPTFRYRWDDRPLDLPWTTVVSDYIDVGRFWAYD